MKTPKITLVNQELKKEFAKVGTLVDGTNPIIIAKFFNPSGAKHGMPLHTMKMKTSA